MQKRRHAVLVFRAPPFVAVLLGVVVALLPVLGDRTVEARSTQQAAPVSIVDFAFNPPTVTVPVGATVTWVNNGQAPHTTTSGTPGAANAGAIWDSGTLQSGQSFSFTFTSAGTFPYFCRIHPQQMQASVTVQAAAAAPAATGAPAQRAPAAQPGTAAQPSAAALPRTGTGLQADTSLTAGSVLGGLAGAAALVGGLGIVAWRRRRPT